MAGRIIPIGTSELWYIPAEYHWYIVGEYAWCIVGEYPWRSVGECDWYIMGECHWYIIGCSVTPIAVHPNDPKTIYIVPEESDEFRVSINGEFAVWRSQDEGDSWQRMADGLPQHADLVVLRDAMTVDACDQPAIYIGTSTGQVFYSLNDGNSWELLADYLPPILSLEIATA